MTMKKGNNTGRLNRSAKLSLLAFFELLDEREMFSAMMDSSVLEKETLKYINIERTRDRDLERDGEGERERKKKREKIKRERERERETQREREGGERERCRERKRGREVDREGER
jgi:hypothetical protein